MFRNKVAKFGQGNNFLLKTGDGIQWLSENYTYYFSCEKSNCLDNITKEVSRSVKKYVNYIIITIKLVHFNNNIPIND